MDNDQQEQQDHLLWKANKAAREAVLQLFRDEESPSPVQTIIVVRKAIFAMSPSLVNVDPYDFYKILRNGNNVT